MKNSFYIFNIFFLSILYIFFLIPSDTYSQWQPVGPYGGTVYSLHSEGTKLLAGTSRGVFLSTDNGESWALKNPGLNAYDVYGVFIDGINLYACGYRWTYRSTNDGQSWIWADSGQMHTNDYNYGFAKKGNNMYLANAQKTYKSINSGSYWFPILDVESFCVYVANNNIYVGSAHGVYVSTNDGINWINYYNIGGQYINAITSISTTLFAGCYQGGVFKSTNNGLNWVSVNNGLPNVSVNALTSSNNILYAGLDSGIYRSTDFGSNWIKLYNSTNNKAAIYSMTSSGNNVYAASRYLGVLKTTDNGNNWIEKNNGLSAKYCWIMASSGSKLFITSDYNTFYYSTNSGNNWISSITGIPQFTTGSSLLSTGNNLFLGSNGKGIFLSTDEGANWVPRNAGIQGNLVNSILYSSGKLLATITNQGVWVSTNMGLNWSLSNSGIQSNQLRDLVLHNGIIFLGTPLGLQKSTDNGITWTQTSIWYGTIGKIFSDGNRLIVTAPFSINISTDNGLSWQYIPLLFENYYDGLYVNGPTFIISGDTGIYVSTNAGSNWVSRSEGLNGLRNTKNLYVYNNYLYLCTYYNSVWRRPLQEMVGINPISSNVPEKYELEQNYPNPFNPTTRIKFALPKNEFVNIKIYDILSKEVASIINENLTAGFYEVEFNANNLSSGMYFYKFETSGFKDIKKMMLIK